MTDRSDENGERVRWFEVQAEAAYERLYDAANPPAAAARYSDAKEFLTNAIALARKLGDDAAVARQEARLAHVKAVYRSQFT